MHFGLKAGLNTMKIEFTLNGMPRQEEVRDDEWFVSTLRERCGITSLKDGCSPQGQCGCCLALVDGHPKTTCAMRAKVAHGKSIVTLDGLPAAERQQIADCFAATAGLQCGFCIPGIALRAKAITDRDAAPTREAIAQALDLHLCRCTGYVKLIDAVQLLAAAKRGAPIPPAGTDGRVGQSLSRVGAAQTVMGQRPFVDDLSLPGMLHGALVLSPHPRARVLAIDTRRALALPGVRAVATAADVPGERWVGLLINDWPSLVAVGEEVRCVGDVLAAVAADDRHTARDAAKLVDVQYEVLPPVLSPEAALAADAPRVNPQHANLLERAIVRRGDADAALAASAHVVSGTWTTQRIEHLFMEPESAVTEPRADGVLHMRTQGQGIFDDRRQVARFLGLRQDQVFVELMPNGGAFGGKEDMSVQAQTALLAQLTGKPVKLTLSREESIRLHPKRHAMSLAYSVGCDAQGRLTAVRARIVGDSGAYASVGAKVLERAAGHACGAYKVPNVDVESVAAYTNNPPCGAMRGFGVNQVHFALEACVDMLATKAGLDRWAMRWLNALDVGDTFGTGQVLEKSVGIRKTLQAIKPHYDAAMRSGRAVGIACGVKNSGIGNGVVETGKARLVVQPDGRVTLFNGFTEMGQGLMTILVQLAVEITGLPASTFVPKIDTSHELDCGQTTGSRGTLLSGRAVLDAAAKLKADLDRGQSLASLAGRIYEGLVVISDTTALGADVPRIKTHTTFGYATQMVVLDAQGRVARVVAAHDAGRVLNPGLATGQIEGAVHMGLGYALTEELRCENGMPVTFKLKEIGVLRARDMPEVEVILVEEPEPEGPLGAKGIGEIGLVPTAAAVAGALEAFDGVRRTTLPMRDSPAARAMSVGQPLVAR
jgi:selenium-dependent xanthine dehydrogenase